MSKKNSLATRKRYNDFIVREEKRREEKRAKLSAAKVQRSHQQ